MTEYLATREAYITLIMGLAAGAAIASTYWAYYTYSLREENNEMRHSLGRPVKRFFKK